MTAATHPHIYLRDIDVARRTSLSVLASLVPVGCNVLDLGTGSGALGKHLSSHSKCQVDGVTHNPAELALAAPHYRRIELLDLESSQLRDRLHGERYERVVCADILEHLRSPEKTLEEIGALLAEEGRLLVSVPNIAYCGLIGELLNGDFRYRGEGLLDRTHLRFFTRRSLLDFFARHGWQITRIETIAVELRDSEFSILPETLPRALLRRLLELPDALTYQFVLEARPLSPGEHALHDPFELGPKSALADHAAALYWDCGDGYKEMQRVVTWGAVGIEGQQLVFPLPDGQGVSRLRLDPADRPGFLHLQALRLLSPRQEVFWQWDGQKETLEAGNHQQMEFGLVADDGLVILMTGDDAFVELPIPVSVLAALPLRAYLEVRMSWPLSSDFLALAASMDSRNAALSAGQSREASLRADNAALLESRNIVESRLREAEAHLRQYEERLQQADDELGSLAESLADNRRQTAWVAEEREQLRLHLRSIEESTLFRATRPLVKVKAAIDSCLAGPRRPTVPVPRIPVSEAPSAEIPLTPPDQPVDIIVPVYRGLEEARICLESVLSSQITTSFRLVVIFDAGPEVEVINYLRDLAAHVPQMLLLENAHNLGFVATVNRGMALDQARDVVLLNSDTEVANDWLDRLRSAAYSGQRVGSVTPLSNNATICSYPRFCHANKLPRELDTASLDLLCARTNRGRRTTIPTGVGFCMYIRRDCLAETGSFDVENFGKGYGEENDFCMRALKADWTHLLALDTFVRHEGGVSFGDSKKLREQEAFEKLRNIHPQYESLVQQHVAEDPARSARLAVDVARIRAAARPVILFVTHARGGGTERHVRELAEEISDVAITLVVRPGTGGIVTIEWLSRDEEDFCLSFRLPDDFDALAEILVALGVVHIHFHHLLGIAPEIWGLPQRLAVSFDYTAHDHYAICPQISLTGRDNRYCGEQGLDQCVACLKQSPASHGIGIVEWRRNYRQFLRQARHIFAPSQDAAAHLKNRFPELDIVVVEHPDLAGITLPIPAAKPFEADRPLKIAAIGALSAIKGADLLEEVALVAAQQNMLLEFHLLGFGYRSLATQPKAALSVHGGYREEDLAALLDWLKPDLVWFPALWPETYSYTLSASLKAGLPVVAPNLGAFPERLAGRAWSWVEPWDQSPTDWTIFFEHIRSRNFFKAIPPPPIPAPSFQHPTFHYRRDYVAGLCCRTGAKEISAGQLQRYAYGRLDGMGAAQAELKRQTLATLVKLRNSRMLRGVARHIPLRWQTRLKTWLAS